MKYKWDDYLNPVLVKEVRQYFHNRTLVILTEVLLGVQLISLLFMEYFVKGDSLDNPAGRALFTVLAIGLGISGFVVCGLGTERRFTEERANQELDFARITPLSPFQIIWGKLASAMVMACYFFALCLPFVVIAYFLRGIEMGVMLQVALIIFISLLLSAQIAILCGTAGKRWMIILYLLGMYQFLQIFLGLGVMLAVRSPFGNKSLPFVLIELVVALLICGFIFVMSMASVNHPAANRILPVRVYAVCLIPAGTLVGWLIGILSDSPDIWKFIVWGLMTGLTLAAAGCATLTVFEREHPGLRVTRYCPESGWGRLLYFLFSSGWSGGILLSWILMLVLGAVAIVPPTEESGIFLFNAMYWIACAEFAILLHTKRPQTKALLFFMIIQGVFFVLGVMFSSLADRRMGSSEAWIIIRYFALFMMLLGAVLIVRRVWKNFRNFYRNAVQVDIQGRAACPQAAVLTGPNILSSKGKTDRYAEVNGALRRPTQTSSSAGDVWNSWFIKCLRQLKRNHVWVYCIVMIVVQIVVIALYMDNSRDGWQHGWTAPAFLMIILGTVSYMQLSFGRARNYIGRVQNTQHFLDFSPIEPGRTIRGILWSHLYIFLLFNLFALILFFCAVFLEPRDLGKFGLWWIFSYLVSLFLSLIVTLKKIELDFFVLCAMPFLGMNLEVTIWPWDLRGMVIYVAFIIYLLECVRVSLLSETCEQGGRRRLLQGGLLLVACLMIKTSPELELIYALPLLLAIFGALNLIGNSINGIPANRLNRLPKSPGKKLLWFVWSGNTSGGWLWAWLISGIAVRLFRGAVPEKDSIWGVVMIAVVLGAELAFIICRIMRRRKFNVPGKTYIPVTVAATTIIVTLVAAIGMMTRGGIQGYFISYQASGWIITAAVAVFIAPVIVRDFMSLFKEVE